METNTNSYRRHGDSKSKVGCALLVILLGVILLGFNLGWIPVVYKPIIVSWQMLLIVLGVGSLVKKHYIGGAVLITVGLFFLLPVISVAFPYLMGGNVVSLRAYWPALLIVGGILFLISKSRKSGSCCSSAGKFSRSRRGTRLHSDANFVEKDIMFGSTEQIVFSSDFKGGDLNVAFGELKLDLRKVTQVNISSLLEANAMFGSIIIYVPEGWYLDMKTSSMFGEIVDKRLVQRNSMGGMKENEGEAASSSFILNLKCSCMFGSVEIRS